MPRRSTSTARSASPLLDCIVIGAGASGVAAARTLIDAGRSVRVLEAAARPGGRAHTDRESLGVTWDRGAAWLHAEARNPLTALVKRAGLTRAPDPGFVLALASEGRARSRGRAGAVRSPLMALRSNGRDLEHACERLHTAYLAAGRAAARGRPDRSLSQIAAATADVRPVSAGSPLTPAGWEAAACAVLAPLSVGIDAVDASALDYATMVDEEEDALVREGLGTLIARLAAGLPIDYSRSVKRIEWTAEGVTVHTAGSSRATLSARTVIITVSTGVLASGAITFAPALPAATTAAIAALPMAALEKVALRFQPGALAGVPVRAHLYDIADPAAAWHMMLRPNGEDLVIAIAGGSFARTIVKLSEADAAELALTRFADAFGSNLRSACTAHAATRWTLDPLTRGAYSAARTSSHAARQTLAEPISNALFFAGEATATEWAATLPGAHETGLRAARAVMLATPR